MKLSLLMYFHLYIRLKVRGHEVEYSWVDEGNIIAPNQLFEGGFV